jgi:hypothetical protein
MLMACGRERILAVLRGWSVSAARERKPDFFPGRGGREQRSSFSEVPPRDIFPLMPRFIGVGWLRKVTWKGGKALSKISRVLRGIRVVVFPTCAKSHPEEGAAIIGVLAAEEEIARALVIGASVDSPCTEALIAGCHRNPNAPIIFCTNFPSRSFSTLRVKYKGVHWIEFHKGIIGKIRAEHGVGSFGLVVYDGESFSENIDYKDVEGSKIIVVVNLLKYSSYILFDSVRSDDNYELQSHEMRYIGSYAVFMRQDRG